MAWSGLDDVIGELHAMQLPSGVSPTAKFIRGMDDALDMAFHDTQALVPVKTGNLRSTGRQESQATPNGWQGKINYGGIFGISKYVDYAAHVQQRNDWMRNVERILDEGFERATRMMS